MEFSQLATLPQIGQLSMGRPMEDWLLGNARQSGAGLFDTIGNMMSGNTPNVFGTQTPEANTGVFGSEAMYEQVGGSIKSPDELEPIFQRVSQETGIDPRVLKAIARIESDFNPRARSKAGAMGIMQLMPGTAKELGVTNPYDPYQSIRGGADYLNKMLKMFGGDWRLAIAAYNAGPGNVRKAGNNVPNFAETQNYVRKFFNQSAVNNALASMRMQ